MRICILGSANSIHIQRWVKALKDMDHDLMVISLYDGEIEGVETVVLPRTSKAFYLSKFPRIKKLIKQFNPDILHSHHASSYGLLGALSGFHPYVISVWGSDVLLFPEKSFIHKNIIQYTLTKADYITATSKALARRTNDLSGKSPTIIPFGVEKNTIGGDREYNKKEITIGIIKDLCHVYGIDVLINSFAELISGGYSLKLMIVGEGQLENELRRSVHEKGIDDRVIFHKRVPYANIVDILNKMDIFALPSRSEGFGVSAVEAMATGVPVVASNVGGLPEVVDDGVTGTLVEPENSGQLVSALIRYIESEELRKKHGLAGIAKVKRLYEWEKNVIDMEAVYKKAVQEL